MDLDESLKRVAVIGAAGKMGSGISLLLLQEMARTEAERTSRMGGGEYVLTLIDTNEKGLSSLRHYLRNQITRYAEKNINHLRRYFANNSSLVSNEEIVRAFVEGALDITRFETHILSAQNATFVFEAIIEDLSTKSIVLSLLSGTSIRPQYYFSNTSSIPISILNAKSNLAGRIIGYHFYNPPAVQKLIEIVISQDTDLNLSRQALELAQRLQKTVVKSNDIAGFIGNGHFIREVLFAAGTVKELSQSHNIPLSEAILLLNRVTQDFLLRPMGIFQLVDYVGIDVCQNIIRIMNAYLPDPSFCEEIIDLMASRSILGGQYPDGTQKNGFFEYSQSKITAVYSIENHHYHSLDKPRSSDNLLGPSPDPSLSWKKLQNDRDLAEKLSRFFKRMSEMDSLGATLARNYMSESQRIARYLVTSGVANKIEDVDTVLKNGFYHLYGSELKRP